jgi:rhodanese-related sulfurtransferase
MIQINKNTIKEVIIIVVIATIIAILYNIIRTDGISFFPKSKEELAVSDDELFDNTDTNFLPADTNIAKNIFDYIDTIDIQKKDSVILDTAKTDAKADTIAVSKETMDYEELIKNAKKSSYGDHRIISLEQMQKIANDKSGNFIIIDARRPDDYAKEHIANAINIFPYDDDNVVMEKIFSLSTDKTIIVYCDGGNCDSSHQIANLLQAAGFKKFYLFEGG